MPFIFAPPRIAARDSLFARFSGRTHKRLIIVWITNIVWTGNVKTLTVRCAKWLNSKPRRKLRSIIVPLFPRLLMQVALDLIDD